MTDLDPMNVEISIVFDQKSSELVTTIKNQSDKDLFIVGDGTEASISFSRPQANTGATLSSDLIEPIRNKLNAADLDPKLSFTPLKAKERRVTKTNLKPIWNSSELNLDHLVYESKSLRGARVQVRAEVSSTPHKSSGLQTLESNSILLPK